MGSVVPIVTAADLVGRLKLDGLADRERLIVMAQNPANYHHWTKGVGEFSVAEARAAFSVERTPISDVLRGALLSSVLFEALNRLTGSAKAVREELAADGIRSDAFDECIAAADAALNQARTQ